MACRAVALSKSCIWRFPHVRFNVLSSSRYSSSNPAPTPPKLQLVRPRQLTWDDLVAPKAVVCELQEALAQGAHANQFRAVQARTRGRPRDAMPGRALLLTGPPGSGKTFAAEVMAAVGERPMFRLSAEQFRTRWHGESEQTLNELLEAAQAAGPCVLFIDEFDSVAHVRRGQVGDAEVAVLLNFMDGIVRERSGDCVVVGATNLPEQVDPAVRSRMQLVHFPVPDEPASKQWWSLNARHLSNDEWQQLAARSMALGPEASFREMEKAARIAEAAAVRDDRATADAEVVDVHEEYESRLPESLRNLNTSSGYNSAMNSDPHSPGRPIRQEVSLLSGPTKRLQVPLGLPGASVILELAPEKSDMSAMPRDLNETGPSGQLACFVAQSDSGSGHAAGEVAYSVAIGKHERSFNAKSLPARGIGWKSFCPLTDVLDENVVKVRVSWSVRVQLPSFSDYCRALDAAGAGLTGVTDSKALNPSKEHVVTRTTATSA